MLQWATNGVLLIQVLLDTPLAREYLSDRLRSRLWLCTGVAIGVIVALWLFGLVEWEIDRLAAIAAFGLILIQGLRNFHARPVAQSPLPDRSRSPGFGVGD